MSEQKEPMIGQESRPTTMDFDTPIAQLKMWELLAVVNAQVAEQIKLTPLPEMLKPEVSKVEKEWLKPELSKPEVIKGDSLKELSKPEKEFLKPELSKPELSKPEVVKGDSFKEQKPGELKPETQVNVADLTERVATRVVDMLKEQGLFK